MKNKTTLSEDVCAYCKQPGRGKRHGSKFLWFYEPEADLGEIAEDGGPMGWFHESCREKLLKEIRAARQRNTADAAHRFQWTPEEFDREMQSAYSIVRSETVVPALLELIVRVLFAILQELRARR